jgi:hypothetical protein
MQRVGFVGLILLGCSFSVSTRAPDSTAQGQDSQAKSAVSYYPHTECARHRAGACASRESPDQCLQALDQECEQQQAKERAEEDRQSKCRIELNELLAADQKRAAEAQRAAELGACENTPIPPGTYTSASDSPMLVKLQVTEQGCAVYEAFRQGTSVGTKTLETDQGYYDQQYKRDWDCTSRGFLTTAGGVKPVDYRGSNCGSVGATISRRATWKRNGVNITLSEQMVSPVHLSRTASTVEMTGDRPSLWPNGRSMSDDQARAGVAFGGAPAAQGANIDALYEPAAQSTPSNTGNKDWCRELEAASAP